LDHSTADPELDAAGPRSPTLAARSSLSKERAALRCWARPRGPQAPRRPAHL